MDCLHITLVLLLSILLTTEEIAWGDIESVFAYKVDWFTFDDVHINLIVNGQMVNIREDIDGFDTFIEKLHQHLPGLKDYWIVVLPAFATNTHCPPGVFCRALCSAETPAALSVPSSIK